MPQNETPPGPPPPGKPKCHRVQGIPKGTTKDELLSQLGIPQGPDPRLTLVRSSAEYLTATLVSSKVPESLEYPVDSRFIGITPLFERDKAAVE